MSEQVTSAFDELPTPLPVPCPSLVQKGRATLYRGRMRLTNGEKEIKGVGTITMVVAPDPSVRFTLSVQTDADVSNDLLGVDCTLEWGNRYEMAALALGRRRWSSAPGAAVITGVSRGAVHAQLKGNAGEPLIRAVRFHVVNFRDYNGSGLHSGDIAWSGRLRTCFGPWTITLDQLQDCEERIKAAKAANSSTVTHIGELRRKDQGDFSADDAADTLEFLYWLLSLVAGFRCGPLLPYGFDAQNKVVWRDWTPTRAELPRSPSNWFPWPRPQEAFSVASAAYDLWQSTKGSRWFTTLVALYTASYTNYAPCELALITACLALETLAYGVPGVQCGRTHVERLRALVNWAGLPVDVPETLPAFRKWASEQDEPLSGPAAVVSVRNWVTHPTDANTKDLASLPPSDRHQAWYLALWYLDVSILHLLNYNGPYRNRANGGAYEAVPWASSDPHHI